jgi:threonine synthase
MNYKGLIEKYRSFLPVSDKTPVITLYEGNTPLVPALRVSALLGDGIEVFLKCEGMNPTGSFKDRGMTLALSKALEEGSKAVICASTGNTSASAAAYAARAGIKCVVILPAGNIALGKLSQALMHGAQVLAIDGNFDEALEAVRTITRSHQITMVNSINPYRIEGQKTASFEICDSLGRAPDFHCLPVGNAGNITAYWKGYKEYRDRGKISNVPRMLGFQAEGAAPIVRGQPVAKPETIATAIRIGNPASWQQATAARDESGGLIGEVSDKQILEAYRLLAAQEGVFVEPASAAPVAGLLKLSSGGFFRDLKKPLHIVCTVTGHGLKDPDCAVRTIKEPARIPARLDVILREIGYA